MFASSATNYGDTITVEGDGTQNCDFVHVADVVRANLLAAVHDDAPGEAFNVGTGSRITSPADVGYEPEYGAQDGLEAYMGTRE